MSWTRWIAAGAVVLGAGGGVAIANGDDDAPITGSALEQAVAAAVQATGGGTVTDTEIGDDGAAYSVEVRLDDGSQVEVNLDADFAVIGRSVDDDGASDRDGAPDD
ncbi:MAG: PepSY domain-containing protein [Acidimicrobiia bacterium]|nr:PepSY domain-containing protein [Acidimicrobiia bacterium]